MPKWRKTQKLHQCQGADCKKVAAIGDRYLDQSIRETAHGRATFIETELIVETASAFDAH